jgi:hypothetical protein
MAVEPVVWIDLYTRCLCFSSFWTLLLSGKLLFIREMAVKPCVDGWIWLMLRRLRLLLLSRLLLPLLE